MENPINDFFQTQDGAVVNGDTPSGISSYTSCIRINGKPILPPLITDERRKELNHYRKKAIEIEKHLSDKRCATFVKATTISTSENSLMDISPYCQSTPTRPVTLKLMPNMPARMCNLSSSSDSNMNKSSDKANKDLSSDTVSSQKSTNKTRSKLFRSTLEQRLANEEVSIHNKKNLYEQSPIIEENYPLYVNEGGGDVDDRKEDDLKRWSPLNMNSINSLRVESRDSHTGDNSFVSIDDAETLTGSPGLMRQNSYTLLTPSPALLQYLETQKDEEQSKRSHSGRKTWDLTNAKKKWSPSVEEKGGSRETTKESSSEGYPVYQRTHNSYTDDGSTSPSSYSFKATSPKFQKIKCKIKSRRVKPHKSVPSPKPNDKVPKIGNSPQQGSDSVFVPFQVKEELSDLSNLLMKMKVEHERQKKELEEKQKSEMKELELLFKRRETELLRRVTQDSPICPRSIYSQYSDPGDGGKFHVQMVGDGRHNATVQRCETVEDRTKRPQSAKDYYYTPTGMDQANRRTRSMDFNQPIPNQDTDLDISFQDSLQSKEYLGNEDMIDTDTVSNCSSQSSTLSSDSKLESMPLLDVKKFKSVEMTPEEFQKYNQAASVITAAARGFLTRRLLRTSHVQSLITTLRDAISCATQLHGATDLGESDVDLMKRLGRQIEAAWEAVYSVFFDTDPATKMQFISSDRERLRSISTKLSSAEPRKRISSATLKSLRRKSGSELLMTRSQITNGSNGGRKLRSRMVASYPSPSAQYKLN